MVNRLRNWYLKENSDHIRVTDITYPIGWVEVLKSMGVPVIEGQTVDRLINWKVVPDRHEIRYDLVGNENKITTGLYTSPLIDHSELLMDFGYQDPIIAIPVELFIENWFRFIASTNFMGTVVVTKDGSLFMEFTDDAESLLISNFPISSNQKCGELADPE